MTLKLKGCPRCKGDVLVDRDYLGWYEWCLQCGYRRDLVGIIKVQTQGKVEQEVIENI